MHIVGPTQFFKSLWQGSITCMSNKFPSDADAVNPETTCWEPLCSLNAVRDPGKDIEIWLEE
jgi:hypothetical protein